MSFPLLYIPAAAPIVSVPAFTYVLDQLSVSPTSAVSARRRLRSAYAGSFLRVERSSDSTQQDFGSGLNELNESALTTFTGTTGASQGYAVKLYDQSGNSRDFAVGAAAAPFVVFNGVANRLNGMIVPATTSTNTSRFMENSASMSTLLSASQFTIIALVQATNGTTVGGNTWTGKQVFGGVEQVGPSLATWQASGRTQYEAYLSDGATQASGATIPSYPDLAVVGIHFKAAGAGGAGLRAFRNGSNNAPDASNNANLGTAANLARLFRGYNSGGVTVWMAGSILEAYYFNTALSNADLNTLGSNLAALGGVTWSTVAW